MHPRPFLVLAPLALAVLLVPAASGDEGATYHGTAFCAWHKTALLAVVVPPTHGSFYQREDGTGAIDVTADPTVPWRNEYTLAAAEALERWEADMRAYAATDPDAAHLAQVTIDTRVLGDTATAEDVERADVTVAFSTVQDAGGRTTQVCSLDETGMNPAYIVMNTWLVYSYTVNDMYNIVLHEGGHALGLSHVEDAPGDLMQPVYPYYVGYQGNPRECVSNLNLLQLAGSFAWAAGAPWTPRPAGVEIAATAYGFLC